MRWLLPTSFFLLLVILTRHQVYGSFFPSISFETTKEVQPEEEQQPPPTDTGVGEPSPAASEPEPDDSQEYEPPPRPKKRRKYRPAPPPEPEPEPEPAINIKPPGLALKFDVPGIKIQLPALRLPGVSLKAKINNPPKALRLFPINVKLPRIRLSTGIGGSFGLSTGGSKGLSISTIQDRSGEDEGSHYYGMESNQDDDWLEEENDSNDWKD